MAKIDDLIDKYFQTKQDELNDYTENIDNPAELVKMLLEFTDSMEKPQDFADLKLLEQFYLKHLPAETLVFADEVLAIHEVILDFYQFMQENNFLTKKDYLNALSFLQKNKHTFLSKMMDEQVWSREKKKRMDEMNQEMIDSLPPEMNDFFQGLNNMFNQEEEKQSTDNVIDFPSDYQEPKSYAIQLRVDLTGYKPPIWRRVLVPFDYTLDDLHEVIQNSFEWENEHLYQFMIKGQFYQPDTGFIDDFGEFPPQDTASMTLGEVFIFNKSIDYIYDFGDDWQHKVKLEKVIPYNELSSASSKLTGPEQLPICLTGRQDAPLEDSRGEEAFASFDLDKINKRLSELS
ncbi:plasmid pRiA4b ORF-3 family protein [Tetragenococcus muriaticus]|uniref:Plasmid pRiA4b Orf3-like domain-containing protein n=2 Tax=Tetragenococcus muriaticus TaxID=64642 RepID=A0A091CE43_9ENTE|nr:plasmid pRiA4b ORF-3 family protein [Tetragenococcus muriaticus]KFN92688.1 hypothetical protein TMU3MR103_0341 [Tetragenococcus muriaticus 3MR10-3]KFN93406.1 hypothetical protein TMUPMC115_0432 [Tetragenococcus muriaticus PMC-11-5]GMA45992.1 hypothetical protein GCM10025854_02400 [Tetragenococcus muriaticus]GMA46219.1 hypothetical protein GCM10025854_04680 [Tetragenococcus muriaticus]GMA48525.1 hypothetical protein GCM10025854_27750 [Tetragenococcus muriaticus]